MIPAIPILPIEPDCPVVVGLGFWLLYEGRSIVNWRATRDFHGRDDMQAAPHILEIHRTYVA